MIVVGLCVAMAILFFVIWILLEQGWNYRSRIRLLEERVCHLERAAHADPRTRYYAEAAGVQKPTAVAAESRE